MSKAFSDLDLAALIDHALLSPIATAEQVAHACYVADRYRFASVCLFPVHVRQAAELLLGKPPKVCAVIGFPCGATTSAVKFFEAQEAVEHGATELDVMINLGWLRMGKTDDLHRELAEIVDATGCPVKAILEMGLLTEAEKRLAVDVCMDAGVAFLKTSTGWNGGATVADVVIVGGGFTGQSAAPTPPATRRSRATPRRSRRAPARGLM